MLCCQSNYKVALCKGVNVLYYTKIEMHQKLYNAKIYILEEPRLLRSHLAFYVLNLSDPEYK